MKEIVKYVLQNSVTGISFMALGPFFSRNLVSIVFPTLTASLIFLDWNHTRKWKKQNKP